MKEFKGTKGEWKAEKSANTYEVHNENSQAVCIMGWYQFPTSVMNKDIEFANAKLIATAPELLEALQLALGMLKIIVPCANNGCDGNGAIQVSEDEWEQCQWCDEKDRIEKAISKALGEE